MKELEKKRGKEERMMKGEGERGVEERRERKREWRKGRRGTRENVM